MQLVGVLLGTAVQGFTDGRLVGTAGAAKGRRQGRVRPHTCVDFDQTVTAGNNIDEGILQLVQRRVDDHFLVDMHMLLKQIPDAHLTSPDAHQRQAGSWRNSDTIVHGDSSPWQGGLRKTQFLLRWLSPSFFIRPDALSPYWGKI